jgi:pimeloyl-ACP methyl ester carboxylesterase
MNTGIRRSGSGTRRAVGTPERIARAPGLAPIVALASVLAVLSTSAFAQAPAASTAPATAPAADAQPVAPPGTAKPDASPRDYLTVAQLRAKYGDRSGKLAVLKGVEVYYKDEGRGPALLLVHGSQSTLRTWDTMARRLKSRYRVIRFDVPNMGLSGSVSDEAAATVDPVDIPVALLEKLGVKRVTFVGNSSGGTLGMFLAAKHPEMVERLILSNTPADPVRYEHMVQPESFKRAQEEAKRAGGFQSLNFWNEYLSYFSARPERISAQKRAEYYDFNRRVPEKHALALIARIGDGVRANELMASVTTPTLLLWGGADPLLTLAAMNSLERHLEKAQVSTLVMPDVGHYPPLEVPDRFTDIVANYIEAVVPASAVKQ